MKSTNGTNENARVTLIDTPHNSSDSNTSSRTPGKAQPRPMQVGRFIFGMLITAIGVGMILVVTFGLFHGWGINGKLTLPMIALCMIIGLMFLGGGFGVMATASATFDDDEFDRLMAGEPINRTAAETIDLKPRLLTPSRGRVEDNVTQNAI